MVERHAKPLNKICDEPTSGTLHSVQVLLISKKKMICSLRTTEDVEKDSKIIKDMKLFPYEKTSNIPKHGDEVPEDMVITGVGHKR